MYIDLPVFLDFFSCFFKIFQICSKIQNSSDVRYKARGAGEDAAHREDEGETRAPQEAPVVQGETQAEDETGAEEREERGERPVTCAQGGKEGAEEERAGAPTVPGERGEEREEGRRETETGETVRRAGVPTAPGEGGKAERAEE